MYRLLFSFLLRWKISKIFLRMKNVWDCPLHCAHSSPTFYIAFVKKKRSVPSIDKLKNDSFRSWTTMAGIFRFCPEIMAKFCLPNEQESNLNTTIFSPRSYFLHIPTLNEFFVVLLNHVSLIFGWKQIHNFWAQYGDFCHCFLTVRITISRRAQSLKSRS